MHLAAARAVRFVSRILPLSVTLVLLAGCSGLFAPEAVTEEAQRVRGLYTFVLIIAGIVFVGVEGAIVWSIFRYRRRDDRLPVQTHGNNLLELIWTAIPTVIVLVLFALTAQTLAANEERSDEPGVVIEALGFQWQWTMTYPDHDYSVTGTPADPPVIGVPVNEPVRVTLPSRDVVHSFYVPAFMIKRDVVPVNEGEPVNDLEFTVTEPGEYSGQCAEFCGRLHNDMTFIVRAMPRAEFDAWIEEAKAGGAGEAAESLPPDAPQLELVAQDLAFDVDRLEVEADTPFAIVLTNNDEGIAHNVSIYDEAGEAVFTGEIFNGIETLSSNVPGLPAGEYRFICDVHPNMAGTLVVGE
jgi:cytochrome c oxidase subunit 2